MKYFAPDSERVNTVYHEFQKGRFDGHTFQKKDSIFLSEYLPIILDADDWVKNTFLEYDVFTIIGP